MPRKQRCRCIGGYPDHWEFSPEEASDKEPVVMSLDEFETIRLLDYEGLTQENCAERMGVARTTVTAIYESARRKTAEALVDGKRLLIRGGNVRLNEICGGIGMGAQSALAEAGIKLYGGVSGSADAAAKALAEGKLAYDPNAKCDHHGHHHGEGHDCGHHHGKGHECGHHHGEGHNCGHHHGDEGCRAHHGE